MPAVEATVAWAKDEEPRDPVAMCEELYLLLQGKVPKGYHIQPRELPHLSAKKAWTVLWFIQNQHYEYPDTIEMCEECGAFFDTDNEGTFVDVDKGPRHFCGICEDSETCARQIRKEERAERRREREKRAAKVAK